MSEYGLYFSLGIDHILSTDGIDHVVFIATLMAPFSLKQWQKFVGLVTAFTLGHMLSLYAVLIAGINVNMDLVELAIPVSIILAAAINLLQERVQTGKLHGVITLVFGLIHGMGFSNYFKGLMAGEDALFLRVLSFNLGVEVGQLVVMLVLATLFVALWFRFREKLAAPWNRSLSFIALVIGIYLMLG